MKELLAKIKRAAEKARPGEWITDGEEFVWDKTHTDLIAEARGYGAGFDVDANAEYIALCSPSNMLQLCAEIERLEKENAELREQVKGIAPQYKPVDW